MFGVMLLSHIAGLVYGAIVGSLAFAGALLTVLAFAVTPSVFYAARKKHVFSLSMAFNFGSIVGSEARSAAWKSQHNFDRIIEWQMDLQLLALSVLLSGCVTAILCYWGKATNAK